MQLHRRQRLTHPCRLFGIHPGHQTQFSCSGKAFKDGDDLIGCLVFPPHGLDHAQALTAPQIEASIRRGHCGNSSPSNTSGNGLPWRCPVCSRAKVSKRS